MGITSSKCNIIGIVDAFVELSESAYENYYKIIVSYNSGKDIVIYCNIIVHKNNMTNLIVNNTYKFTIDKKNKDDYYQVVDYKKLKL